MAITILAVGCGNDEVPELTVEERLALVEGRALTPGEVSERLAVAATVCRMEGSVLDALWRRLDENQLLFQDIAFSEICPERSTFYAGLTGRYVTDEAEQSGVVTSTTRPATTTTRPGTTAGRPTIAPVPTSPLPGGVPPTATTEPPSSTSTTIAPSISTTTAPSIGTPTTRLPTIRPSTTLGSLQTGKSG